MSSPIAKKEKGFIDKLLIKFHQKIVHKERQDILADKISSELKELLTLNHDNIRIIDIGCGDMNISNEIKDIISGESINGLKITNIGIDIYPNIRNWENYYEYNGTTIPFGDGTFNIALLCDVLHHDYENSINILTEALRVAEFIIIKDHFEYGYISRKFLQLADILGNLGYGITIPKKYFDKLEFSQLIKNLHCQIVKTIHPLKIYNNKLFQFFIRDKYQFISIIKK